MKNVSNRQYGQKFIRDRFEIELETLLTSVDSLGILFQHWYIGELNYKVADEKEGDDRDESRSTLSFAEKTKQNSHGLV